MTASRETESMVAESWGGAIDAPLRAAAAQLSRDLGANLPS